MSIVDYIRKNAKNAKWTGVFLIIAGFLALVSPFAAGLSVTIMIGVLLLFGGIMQLFLVFRAGSFSEGLLLAVLGLLSIAAGIYSITQPGSALGGLTLFLAAYFVAAGIIETISAFGAKPADGWGWLLFGGVASVLLGLMIWGQFPLSGAVAIGTLVGIRLLISGWTLVAIGGTAQSLTKAAA